MTARLRPLVRQALALLALLVVFGPARAHELSMAELTLREAMPGQFIWQWGAGDKRSPAEALQVQWPQACRVDGNAIDCRPEGLRGPLRVDGLGQAFSAVVLKVHRADGALEVHPLTKAQPEVRLAASGDDARGTGEVAWSYLRLGVEHILGGIDHLLFVIGLLLLVGIQRRLIWTITAFTLAHSLTLGASALGWIALRPAPVEAVIALSIVLVAAEALSPRPTLARRWPALVAFLFGLFHGLGFAGALQDIGLPPNHLLTALLAFNGGVEIGQLMVVGIATLLAPWLATLRHAVQARRALLYAIGALASYWSLLRIAAMAG